MLLLLSVYNESDCISLQEDIHKISNWCSTWQLNLNFAKCSVLSVTLKKKPCLFNYSVNNNVLNRVSVQKDLGIFIDCKLNFVYHVNHLIKKTNRMIGLEWRNFRSCKNEQIFRTLFCTIIRPHLEYCTVAFNSISKTQSDRLERVQRRYLLFMFRILNREANQITLVPTYLQLCQRFNLPTLHQRRTINDCLFLYKHIHNHFNLTDANPYCLHVPQRHTRSTTNHILLVPWSWVEVTKQGFVSRISSARCVFILKDCPLCIMHNA